MNNGISTWQEEFGASIAALAGALAAGDESRFLGELDALVQRRESSLFGELQKLTTDLQGALNRFRIDSRLVDLAEKEVPDARLRLDHVLKLTDEAAHRTMDLVEQCGPLAERTSQQAGELVRAVETLSSPRDRCAELSRHDCPHGRVPAVRERRHGQGARQSQ